MTEILRVIAVDDEPLALRRVELLLGQIEGVKLLGTAGNGPEALEMARRLQPEVMLLDIKMAGLTGFDIAERLEGPVVPLVIFVTAFDHFASRAFEIGAQDYVLKPVERPRLEAALERARASLKMIAADERLVELRRVVAVLREELRAAEPSPYETELWAESRGAFARILVDDLLWVEAERDYLRLHAHGQSYLMRETLTNLEARLDPGLFLRVRRSALVKRDRMARIRKPAYGDVRVVLDEGSEIRVGRTYLAKVRALMDQKKVLIGSNSDAQLGRMRA